MDEFCGNCGAKLDLAISDVCPNCGAKSGKSKFSKEVSNENYAGFWIRFVAYIIDGLILFIPAIICFAIAGSNEFIGYLLMWIVGFAYFVYLESSWRMATFGKQAMGLVVTNMDGSQLSIQTASIRYVAKIISAVILYIGFIMIGFTEKKQGLHDMIANTLVVKK